MIRSQFLVTFFKLNFGIPIELFPVGNIFHFKRIAAVIFLLFSILLGTTEVSKSDDFERGMISYLKGDYSSALRAVMPRTAEQVDEFLEGSLGVLYGEGKVPENVKTDLLNAFLHGMVGVDPAVIAFSQVMFGGDPIVSLEAQRKPVNAINQDMPKDMSKERQVSPQEDKTAVGQWTLAAEQGNANAQFILGLMHDDGEVVTRNSRTAVKWYKQAAEQGHALAQGKLIAMYASGTGTPKSNVNAYIWAYIAEKNGNKLGAELRADLENYMRTYEVRVAQFLALKCIKKKYKNCPSM